MVSYFDLVVTLLIVGSGAWSAYRGLVREVFAFLALIIGVIVATAGYGVVMPFCEGMIGDGLFARVISFAIIFGLSALVVILIGHALQKVIKILLLGWVDRAGGFAIGLLKGLLVCGVVLLLLDKIDAVHDYIFSYSDFSPWLIDFSRAAFELLPRIFERFVRDFS